MVGMYLGWCLLVCIVGQEIFFTSYLLQLFTFSTLPITVRILGDPEIWDVKFEFQN